MGSEQELADTKKRLEYLSREFVNAVNNRDWTMSQSEGALDALAHVDPEFRAYGDDRSHSWGVWENAARLKERVDQDPNFYMRPLSMETDVDMTKGLAVVYMYTEITGTANVARMEGLRCYHWRRHAGDWWVYRFEGMRSSEIGSGFLAQEELG